MADKVLVLATSTAHALRVYQHLPLPAGGQVSLVFSDLDGGDEEKEEDEEEGPTTLQQLVETIKDQVTDVDGVLAHCPFTAMLKAALLPSAAPSLTSVLTCQHAVLSARYLVPELMTLHPVYLERSELSASELREALQEMAEDVVTLRPSLPLTPEALHLPQLFLHRHMSDDDLEAAVEAALHEWDGPDFLQSFLTSHVAHLPDFAVEALLGFVLEPPPRPTSTQHFFEACVGSHQVVIPWALCDVWTARDGGFTTRLTSLPSRLSGTQQQAVWGGIREVLSRLTDLGFQHDFLHASVSVNPDTDGVTVGCLNPFLKLSHRALYRHTLLAGDNLVAAVGLAADDVPMTPKELPQRAALRLEVQRHDHVQEPWELLLDMAAVQAEQADDSGVTLCVESDTFVVEVLGESLNSSSHDLASCLSRVLSRQGCDQRPYPRTLLPLVEQLKLYLSTMGS